VSGAVYADHGYPHRTRERGSLGLAHTGEARVRDEIVEQVHAVPLHIFVTSRSRRATYHSSPQVARFRRRRTTLRHTFLDLPSGESFPDSRIIGNGTVTPQ